MTALERNSDLIVMSAYAPMLVNVSPGAMQWTPNLIGFDAERTYVSPSYYAQSLFAGHLGDGCRKLFSMELEIGSSIRQRSDRRTMFFT